MKLVRRSALALVLFTSLAGIAPAWAAEEPPLVTALLKSWENQLKVKPTYQALTTESDGSIVIDGLTATVPTPGDPAAKMSFAVGKIKLSGVTDKANGLYEVAAV
ncbi:MAG: hypothetical protein E6G89_18325 [Alphaproteobacteria bacterium]|nr:MAG: hypothetical protein E6G89_18325 [Alphaproteobacteria bacterium]